MEDNKKLFTKEYYISPGDCSGQGELPVWRLLDNLIETATYHANSWGVGYAKLIQENRTWVLSRVAIEMKRYPHVNETYTVTTWVDSFNRHYSQRYFKIADTQGNTLGYAKTIWVVIDLTTRASCDISALSYIAENVFPQPCPIEGQSRIRLTEPSRTAHHSCLFTDIDFNRHVNSTRYVCLFLNQWSMEHYDSYFTSRFEISFMKEAYAGEELTITVDESDPLDAKLSLNRGDVCLSAARIVFSPRENGPNS